MELKVFNQSVNNRFNTLIKTIEDKSNTFFDAYLNMLEATIKFILDENNIIYDSSQTCGTIFRKEEVKLFFYQNIKIDEKMYNKVLDYVKKSNDSKHKDEKQVDINAILVRMDFYYSFINMYYKYIKSSEVKFDATEYFIYYGKTERVNKEYKEELNRKIAELENAYKNKEIAENEYNKYKSLLENTELEKFSLDEQNDILKNQISILTEVKNNIQINDKLDNIAEKLDNFIFSTKQSVGEKQEKNDNKDVEQFFKGASKEYVWVDLDSKSLITRKKQLWLSGLAVLVFGLFAAIYVTKLDIYTTYTLIENIFMFQTILVLLYSLSYKDKILDTVLSKKSTYKYEYNYQLNTMFYIGKEKSRYKIIRILTYVASLLNVIYVLPCANNLAAIIFEILFFISVIIFTIFKRKINDGYEIMLLFKNFNKNNKKITIGYDFVLRKYYANEDLKKHCEKLEIDEK